ncbi:MAG: hypothetical protein MUP30_12505 [Deltaproteobacteria bacterium]|nr:hypothetical protein [Deltaproteobacteria bacterium]
MSLKKQYVITLLIFILFLPWSTFANENILESLLTKAGYPGISRKQISTLLSYKPNIVLKKIREIHSNFNCKAYENVLSQYAILYLGIHGSIDDIRTIKSLWECANSKSTELLPCEYYCAYEFSITLLNIKFKGEKPPVFGKGDLSYFHNKYTTSLQADSIEYLLKDMNEAVLLKSIDNKSLRPRIPNKIIDGLNDSQTERFYKEAVYFILSKKAKDIKTRDILFQELLYYYFRDVSGDGGVNILQKLLWQIEKRMLTNK